MAAIAIPADYDAAIIATAAGGSPGAAVYAGGVLTVAGVDQAALDTALAGYDHFAVLKRRARETVANLRWRAETAGIVAAGVPIRTDRDSQALVDGLQRALADGIVESVEFKPADGETITADLATATAIRDAVVTHVQACRAREADLLADIEAAADADALAAVDPAAGWPGGKEAVS